MVCDEPTSALDVSVQAAILNLLADLQRDEEVAYLFISHDLGVVRYLSDRIAVLYLGRLMELGPAEVVFARAAPSLHRGAALGGARASRTTAARASASRARSRSHADPPSGCVFHTRCPRNHRRDLRAAGAAADRGRAEPRDALPHPDRGAAQAAGARGRRVRIRAAVLERTGARQAVEELELAPPGPGEVLVRLAASGVCHSDLNAIDGTAETRCPAVLGHEGAGRSRRSARASRCAPVRRSRSRGRPPAAAARSACAASASSARRPGPPWAPAACSTAPRACRPAASPSTTTRCSRRSPRPRSCRSAPACRSPTTRRSPSPRSWAAP